MLTPPSESRTETAIDITLPPSALFDDHDSPTDEATTEARFVSSSMPPDSLTRQGNARRTGLKAQVRRARRPTQTHRRPQPRARQTADRLAGGGRTKGPTKEGAKLIGTHRIQRLTRRIERYKQGVVKQSPIHHIRRKKKHPDHQQRARGTLSKLSRASTLLRSALVASAAAVPGLHMRVMSVAAGNQDTPVRDHHQPQQYPPDNGIPRAPLSCGGVASVSSE